MINASIFPQRYIEPERASDIQIEIRVRRVNSAGCKGGTLDNVTYVRYVRLKSSIIIIIVIINRYWRIGCGVSCSVCEEHGTVHVHTEYVTYDLAIFFSLLSGWLAGHRIPIQICIHM